MTYTHLSFQVHSYYCIYFVYKQLIEDLFMQNEQCNKSERIRDYKLKTQQQRSLIHTLVTALVPKLLCDHAVEWVDGWNRFGRIVPH